MKRTPLRSKTLLRGSTVAPKKKTKKKSMKKVMKKGMLY